MPDDDQDFVMPGIAGDNQLPEDNDRPFTAQADPDDDQLQQHQSTDDDLDDTELYHEGLSGAAEQEPPKESAVTSYTPPEE